MTEANKIEMGQRICVAPAEGLQVLNIDTAKPYQDGDEAVVDTRILRLLADGDLILAEPKTTEPKKAEPAKK